MVGQILLTGSDFTHKDRAENLSNTIERLIELHALPIINENDSVATEEIKVGDNDTLSALVAVAAKADLLILLSDIDGLYDGDPKFDKNAKLIPVVENLNDEIMKLAGETVEIAENKIDAASAISGCGPAFVAMFAEALADGGVRCGLTRAVAEKLASQTLIGSAALLKGGEHPEELKDAVCSPGGTTIEGVTALENKGFRYAVIEAVTKAYEKNFKL